MRKNFGAKPWSYPQPVFIIAAYDEAGNPDAMNAAWGGISDTAEVSICLSASHKTVKTIRARKAFTITRATASQVVACGHCRRRSRGHFLYVDRGHFRHDDELLRERSGLRGSRKAAGRPEGRPGRS